ncbi:MAG: DUF2283 domain-containing protein [Streptosporangiaceae bacterium]
MRLKYDLNIGALYVALADRPVARTRELDDNTFIDLDEDGDVIGIEVISIRHPWALGDILREYSIPSDEVAQLRAYFQPDDIGPVLETPAVSMDRNAPVLI